MTFPGEILSPLASDPLFSSIIVFTILMLLYFPTLFVGIMFSPVLISTTILLLSLRFGAIQRSTTQEKNFSVSEFNSIQPSVKGTHLLPIDDHKRVSSESNESPESQPDSTPKTNVNPCYADSFVEWDVTAPLEVIYEGYEGEGEENENFFEEQREAQMAITERYESLSKFYPETDSDTSSEEDLTAIRYWEYSPENICFQWDVEDREGLIEIELEQKRYSELEEDNLIEIDLSPTIFMAR